MFICVFIWYALHNSTYIFLVTKSEVNDITNRLLWNLKMLHSLKIYYHNEAFTKILIDSKDICSGYTIQEFDAHATSSIH